jgi:Zn finger protein HypA/HybF involved in hydrogenase expression
MNATDLAEQLMLQLTQIAARTPHGEITQVEMTVGALWNISADDLELAFEDLFADADLADAPSQLGTAIMRIRLVQPGEQFQAPGRSDTHTASGWELLVTNIRGRGERGNKE